VSANAFNSSSSAALQTVGAPEHPLYSAYFTGSSPFHATVSYLKSLPGTIRLPSTTVMNYWNQTWYTIKPALGTPMFSATPHRFSYAFSCLLYAKPNPCNANGKAIWFNTDQLFSEDDADHHIVSVDPISGYEIDGWGGDASFPCNVTGRILNCSWGGIFPYRTGGLIGAPGNAAVHAGFAIGAFILSAQDMLNGLSGTPIRHALGVRAKCLDNLPSGGAAYPADAFVPTDTSCSGSNNGGPAGTEPAYGDLFVLNMMPADIAATSYSQACKVILNALATYGAYLMDTGGGNNAIWVENPRVYGDTNNPWYEIVEPAFGDDGNDTPGVDFTFQSCMNRLSPSDFQMYEIQRGAGR
jgi:hypothetical protein